MRFGRLVRSEVVRGKRAYLPHASVVSLWTVVREEEAEQYALDLASIIMSEAPGGNEAERAAIGFCVINRMIESGGTIQSVQPGFLAHRRPSPTVLELAAHILNGETEDNSGGAVLFYSPRAMPREGEATGRVDIGGGLELTPGLARHNYRPGWSLHMEPVEIAGVREAHFKFYRIPTD